MSPLACTVFPSTTHLEGDCSLCSLSLNTCEYRGTHENKLSIANARLPAAIIVLLNNDTIKL